MTSEQARAIIRAWFPLLSAFEVTSPPSKRYNCIAWAAGEDHLWWWPGGPYWPDGVAKDETVEAFTLAYGRLGYACCEDLGLEHGFEKIALFVGLDGRVVHAARQLADGRWSSKLGEAWDITHELNELEGEHYGRVGRLLKRPAALARSF